MTEPSCYNPGVPVEPRFDGDYTHNTGQIKSFTILDFFIFSLSLLIPIIIGFYQGWRRRHTMDFDEYMLARRSMSYLPVGLSLLSTFLSAISALGIPAEVYKHDTLWIWTTPAYFILSLATAHIYMPVFYHLKINSVYEYLELRFNRTVRTVGSSLFIIQTICYMPIVLYAPSLAFSEVSGLNLWGSIVTVGLVCTFYVTVGGVRAVVWTDSFQMCLMFASALVMVFGAMTTIGIKTMWDSAHRTERLLFLDFRLNPTIRHTVWNLVFGYGTTLLALYVGNQAQVHRYLTCRTLRDAKKAVWISCPGYILFGILSIIIGLYMSALYENCDPLQTKLVDNSNQLIPLFMQDILSSVPGLPGVYLAGIFSGTLSTMSSGLNTISMVVIEDFIRIHLKSRIHKDKERLISQIICAIFGFVCLEITFLVPRYGSVLQASASVLGIFAGPLLGLFSLGIFFPWVNEKGALGGLFGAMAITFGITTLPTNPQEKSPLACISNCNVQAFENISNIALQRVQPRTTAKPERYEGFQLYRISYMWYSLTACFNCIIIGCIVSHYTGSRDPKDVDPRLIVPVLDDIFPFYYLPEHTKKYYRFGIDHEGKFEKKILSTLFGSKEDVILKSPKDGFSKVANSHSVSFETEL
ncbi:hypothetical protein RRG08_061836 [Elysia crispata]|uniref:Sodium-coupled monocarboxylate transporter 1 n=1 Tax=Elysia crispata TaxID=231223 RepID=A0AAE0ZZI4_9GAST|nr:hypothetical protein RRG08_061836 [Elysia crispata]